MRGDLWHLLRTKRFLPLFVTQALGAFNDNAFRWSLVVLITYDLAARYGVAAPAMVVLASALFMLPFVLFSAIAGQLADKYEKSQLIQYLKITELVIVLFASAGFLLGHLWLQLGVLFLLGTQSAFFGPLKYGILPQHLETAELIGGNALVELATYLAILFGQLFGGIFILHHYGPEIVSLALVLFAAAGLAASRYIPPARSPAPALRLNFNIATQTWAILRFAGHRKDVLLAVLGIAWFWLVGSVYLIQMPPLTKDVLAADQQVTNIFLACFSIGIGTGAVLCHRLLGGEISARYVPLGALAITLFGLDMVFAAQAVANGKGGGLDGPLAFISQPANWRILFDMFALAVGAGLYVVPLYAIIQARAEPVYRARVIASTNIMNSLFVSGAAGVMIVMLDAGATVLDLFVTVAGANAFVAVAICAILPGGARRAMVRAVLKLFFGLKVSGKDNYDAAGDKAVIVANHASTLDPVILAACLPNDPVFAIDPDLLGRRWLRWVIAFLDLETVDPRNAMAIKTLTRALKAGRKCVIFPEGRPTVTGSLMKIYEGPGTIAHSAAAPILPIRIDGAQASHFSLLKGKRRLKLFPRISLFILAPVRFDVPERAGGRSRREFIAERLYDLMTEMLFDSSPIDKTMFAALIDARSVHGGGKIIAEDADCRRLSYRKLITGCFVLGRQLERLTERGEHVGVLLPNTVPTAVIYFGLQAYERVPTMMNFSTGARNMAAASQAAAVRTILTSRRFIEIGQMEEAEEALARVADIIYLEDIAQEIGLREKIHGAVQGLFPRIAYRRTAPNAKPDDKAVILFTSGSEGSPKGVALSHYNVQANLHQVATRVDFTPSDKVFNALPIFHSFGMTGGLALPLLWGVPTFLYPSPLHYRTIPEAVYASNATIMFGTDTFLAGYARSAHPYDFYSVRYIFAGAEKLKRETRQLWMEKFGIRVFEGYGVTETSPVLAVNTPMQCKPGTVGRLMPGVEYRIEPVEGIDEGGRLVVKGPNIMLGYLRNDKPGELQAPPDGWYDTGDIVSVDDEGYITIIGRAKRFAKIAGEMVSLTAVEGFVAANWPDFTHAAVSVADAKKGERIVLITDYEKARRGELVATARAEGVSELMIPRDIIIVEDVPVLGTGKIDYVRAQHIALEHKD